MKFELMSPLTLDIELERSIDAAAEAALNMGTLQLHLPALPRGDSCLRWTTKGGRRRKRSSQLTHKQNAMSTFHVRLGKFKKLSNGDTVGDINDDDAIRELGETNSSNLDAKRCFFMGSYQYVGC
ncbi:hypothetical protein Cni_G20258 [Canna indica]|uniref:Uncharacterized protein n=1 Tax=Canna indica TaxID=4628 RepID=A0AAQ3KNR0_9LILI|nr:hypothetical protein Cni_G20258 [Canna indica]